MQPAYEGGLQSRASTRTPMTTFTDSAASFDDVGTSASEPTKPSAPNGSRVSVVGSAFSVVPGAPAVNDVAIPERWRTFVRTSTKTLVGSRQLDEAMSTPAVIA